MELRVALALLTLATTAPASTITLTGGAWYPLDLSTINGDGIPYMDYPSADGPGKSMLELLPPGNYEYYGNAANPSAAPESIAFMSSVDVIQFTMLAKLTAFADFNAIWLHPLGNPGQRIDVFSGSDRPITTKNIQVPGTFALCINSGAGFKNCSDIMDGPLQRWAVVRDISDGSLYFGVEDLEEQDRNEPLGRMSAVPELNTTLMMVSAMCCFAAIRKRLA